MRVWLVLAVVGLSGVLVLGSGENDSPMGASGIKLGDVTTGTVSQPKDPVDWWKVYVPGSGVLVVFLDGAQAHDVDLYFYDSNLDLLAQSTGRGQDEVVYGRIQGGWYYIKVQSYFRSPVRVDYELGALYTTRSGYLSGQRDIDFYRLSMQSGRTYWIFLVDLSSRFDPDLFLAHGDDILAESDNAGDIDVIKYSPRYSLDYTVAVGSASGSGYYYLLVGSR